MSVTAQYRAIKKYVIKNKIDYIIKLNRFVGKLI